MNTTFTDKICRYDTQDVLFLGFIQEKHK